MPEAGAQHPLRQTSTRDRATLQGIVPPDWPGLLIRDCLSVYDAAFQRQHKCYAHHLRPLSIARRDQNPPASRVDDWLGRVQAVRNRKAASGK